MTSAPSLTLLAPCRRMLSLNLIGASFLCLQKNNHQYYPRPSAALPLNGKEDWGTVVAETTNCLFVAYRSPSAEPKVDTKIDSFSKSSSPETEPAAAPDASPSSEISIRRFIKEACIFAITSVDVVSSFSPCSSHSPVSVQFPVCVIHGKQHLPHLLQNHSSRTFSEASGS